MVPYETDLDAINPDTMKPVLQGIVRVFDEINHMNRAKVFKTLEILRNTELTLEERRAALRTFNADFDDVLRDIITPLDEYQAGIFEASLNVQVQAILVDEKEQVKAQERWQHNLLSKGMVIHKLTKEEFEALNPKSERSTRSRERSVLGAVQKDLERRWMGLSFHHVCVFVDGQLYRVNSVKNIFGDAFIPMDVSIENLETINANFLAGEKRLSLGEEEIKNSIGYDALSNAYHRERFEWEYKKRKDVTYNSIIFYFNSFIKYSVRPLDVLGSMYDDLLLYLNNMHAGDHFIYNLACFVATLGILTLAATAIATLCISGPTAWAIYGAFSLACWILTGAAIVSRAVNWFNQYIGYNAANNPEDEAYLSKDSKFRLTDEEAENYRRNGYDEDQIQSVKEALLMLAVDAKLFSESGRARYHSLFADKLAHNTLLRDLKSCNLAPHNYEVITESRFKHGGIDRVLKIGPPAYNITEEARKTAQPDDDPDTNISKPQAT